VLGLKEEHAAVPEMLAALQEFFGAPTVRLLDEARDLEGVLVDLFSDFDVPETSVRPRRQNSDRGQVVLFRRLDGQGDSRAEACFVGHEVITRQHADDRVRILARDGGSRPTDAGRGVSRNRLGQDLRLGDLGQNGRARFEQMRAGGDVDILGSDERIEPSHRGREKRFVGIGREREKLLGPVGP